VCVCESTSRERGRDFGFVGFWWGSVVFAIMSL